MALTKATMVPATSVPLSDKGVVDQAISWVTPEMFGAKSDGIFDDAIAIQAAVDYAESINSSTLTRAPRVGIRFAATTYYLNQTIKVSKGTVRWVGAGMYQTLFTPHSAASDESMMFKYFFDFSSPHWVSNATRMLHEVHLSGFTFLGKDNVRRPCMYLGGVGWDCVIDTVHFYSSGLSAIVADDLFDTQFYNTRINSCGRLHDPSNPQDIFTHAILFRGKYDNCNAIRFYAPHFEANFIGVLGISGRSNNIWLDSAKFEYNSRGTASGASYPVVDLNGPLIESIKFSSPFVSHPASIKQWFLSSNARNVEIMGGSLMSPSDLSGYTAERWINIHRTGWASATRCVGLVADITMMHVNGAATLGDAPIKLANDAVLSIKAPRVTDPNKFIEVSYDCDININYLTLLGSITSDRQTALFNVTAPNAKVNIDVERTVGSISNLVFHNQNMTDDTRRKSKATLRFQNTQNGVGELSEGTDTFGVDEGYVWQAKGEVANLPPCHIGKQLVVRCPDASNRLVKGGNVFLTSDITGAATVVLQSTNFAFRKGWMEVSRLTGV